MAERVRSPRTPAEWQEVANLAEAMLLIHSAACYGLITGGPEIVPWRCDVLLTKARQRGITPQKEAVMTIAVTFAKGGT